MSKHRMGPLPADEPNELDIVDFTLTSKAPPAERRQRTPAPRAAARKPRPDPLAKLKELREKHGLIRPDDKR